MQISGPDTHVHVEPPGDAEMRYCVIGAPPVLVGSCHVTVTWLFPATTVVMVGAPGVVEGVTDPADAAGLGPATFTATTVKV